jgi:hypothetical protein
MKLTKPADGAQRLVSWFFRPTAGNPASAERMVVGSAAWETSRAENARFVAPGETEQQVR